MNRLSFLSRIIITAAMALATCVATAGEWTPYRSKAYGFSMLVPKGTDIQTSESPGGWGKLYAAHGGTKLFGLGKLGKKESDEVIEKFAIQTIGIPATQWKQIDQRKNQRGWERMRTFQATKDALVVFGIYGVGPKGSYLLYMETTADDFKKNRAEYQKWHDSLRLF